MSAMPPIAPESMRWGELTRCAKSGHCGVTRAINGASRAPLVGLDVELPRHRQASEVVQGNGSSPGRPTSVHQDGDAVHGIGIRRGEKYGGAGQLLGIEKSPAGGREAAHLLHIMLH